MTNSPTDPLQMRASCPEDLLAFVPVAIGFTPSESVVMLTVDGTRPFHARIDLPGDECDVREVVEALLRPARVHRLRRVVFVVYADNTLVADETAWSLHATFTEHAIDVLDVLRVHDDHYFAVLPGRPATAYDGVSFDVGSHPFAAQSVFGGRVTHASRQALADTIAHDAAGAEAVSSTLTGSAPLTAEQLRRVVHEHADAPCPPSPELVGALALSLTQGSLRDEAWRWLTRSRAREHLGFWSDIVRRTPLALVPGPAAVLALTAWLAGEGALAWCAVDRAREVDPAHSLAQLVADLLMSATPPETWSQMVAPVEGVA
ncbi:DUF4192 domain-containing protein [Nocardioides piscis]|uniref:DUF4192 domain-containing protein n=1 Tax=Nocardioides piscis TaxID=2714938 RepID=A0A6G7YHV1_9ACTN|nr:DUF4192 domain-containing protein [Nocardioides piscis]QIK76309.1 DUF4192 domain-containing protein [Nocardioides piscis]